jgi:hypothetical protein
VSLDKIAVPKNKSTVFRAAENLTIWKFSNSSDVGELQLAELTDFTLKLKTCEGLSHLPKSNVTATTSKQDIICVGRESDFIDFLREGLSFQYDFLNDPVPNCDGIIRVTTNTRKLLTRAGEFNVRKEVFSAVSQNAVKFQAWILVYENVRHAALFSNCEIFP